MDIAGHNAIRVRRTGVTRGADEAHPRDLGVRSGCLLQAPDSRSEPGSSRRFSGQGKSLLGMLQLIAGAPHPPAVAQLYQLPVTDRGAVL